MILELFAAVGLASAAVTLWSADRMRRKVPRLAEPVEASAVLVIPATGELPRLEALHGALLAQRCPPVRVVFVVETRDDPAYERLQALAAESPLVIEVVVAGEAATGSQKCHNLAMALSGLEPNVPFVVLADVDILPPPDWLGHLLRPLTRDAADIVTGYRWPVPADARGATLFGTWIDRAVAGLPKPNRGWLTWGGSIAMRRDVVDRLDLPGLFESEISDDMALAVTARKAGCRILFRGAVLVPTPFGHAWPSLFAFGRRQYQMFLLYQPRLWAWAAATVAVNLLGSAALTLLAFQSLAGLAAFGLFAVMIALADGMRRAMARRAGIEAAGPPLAEAALRLMPLVLPLVHLIHLAAVLLSLDRRKVVWGHCTYRMRGGRVTGIERRRWSSIVSQASEEGGGN